MRTNGRGAQRPRSPAPELTGATRAGPEESRAFAPVREARAPAET